MYMCLNAYKTFKNYVEFNLFLVIQVVFFFSQLKVLFFFFFFEKQLKVLLYALKERKHLYFDFAFCSIKIEDFIYKSHSLPCLFPLLVISCLDSSMENFHLPDGPRDNGPKEASPLGLTEKINCTFIIRRYMYPQPANISLGKPFC